MADKLAEAEAKKQEGNAAFGKKDYETAIGFYSEVISCFFFFPLFNSLSFFLCVLK